MYRNRRGWEEPATSDPIYGGRAYYDDYRWRHDTLSTDFLPRTSFNYWGEEAFAPTSYYPQRSYNWGSHDQRWRDDGRSWQSSYPTRRRDPGPGHGREDLDSRRNALDRSSSRRHYSTYAPAPYIPRPAFQSRSPPISPSPVPKSVPPLTALKASSLPQSPPESIKPSASYLAVADAPSTLLQDPRKSRKLLVLDLNGTLLIRSARSRVLSGPQLRPVQPRPYMQSFRQYLFCEDTKAWLDAMVWSSAQPHSVHDMVDKVFGTTKHELKAVWDRKSIGLSDEEYYQKTVTKKDLSKPWDMFSSPSPVKIEGCSTVPSQSQRVHSAFTTLLLDDSLHKAVLQPYNHVCVPHYDSMRRQRDLRSFLSMEAPKETKKDKKDKQKHMDEAGVVDQAVLEPSSTEKEPYDVVLLVVIGVLEAVKLQSNVAGWIRKGGLWATEQRREEANGCVVHDGDGDAGANAVVRAGNDTSSTSDPAVSSAQADLQTRMWFDDPTVVAYWVARGRKALMDLGIQVTHGVRG